MNGAEISSSQSDHKEVDNVEEMLATIGNFGIFPGMPTGDHLRGVYWADEVNGSNSNDGTTASDAVATIDYAVGLTTANQDDVILVLKGGYNEYTNAGGVLVDVAGIHIFGLGQGLCTVENDDALATAVFTVSVSNVEIAGFFINETTPTVEGITTSGADNLCIHHNLILGAMENGIHLASAMYCEIFKNKIVNISNDGIEVSGASVYNEIYDNYFFGILDNAINLNGNGVDSNFVGPDNIINGNSGATDVGVNIVLGDNNEVVGNEIWGCVLSEQDTGTGNRWNNECPKKRVVYPASGAGVSITSSGAGADTWGSWVTVMTPTAPFTVETIEVDFLHQAEHHIQVGQSGDTNADRVHLQVRESGTVGAFTRGKPRFYPQGTTISARQKSRLGSGGPSTVWVWTEEPD